MWARDPSMCLYVRVLLTQVNGNTALHAVNPVCKQGQVQGLFKLMGDIAWVYLNCITALPVVLLARSLYHIISQ